jgi:uncharacterized protein YecT (DUF1311 family)
MRQFLFILASLLMPSLAGAQNDSYKNPTKHCWDDSRKYAESVACAEEYLQNLKAKVEVSYSKAHKDAKDWDQASIKARSPYGGWGKGLENSQNAFLEYVKAECGRTEAKITNSQLLKTEARTGCEISLYSQRLNRLGTE